MSKHNVTVVLIVVLFFYIGVSIFLSQTSGLAEYDKHQLDSQITVKIEHPDGTTDEYNSNKFSVLNKGDVLYANIPLPKKAPYDSTAICFYIYNSTVQLSYDSNTFYTYGKKQVEKGRMIGDLFVRANIPDAAWGHSLTLKCVVQEDEASSKLYNVLLMDSVNSIKYFIKGNEAAYLMCITIMVIAALILLVVLFWNKWNLVKRQGIYLCMFCLLICSWVMGYNGLYYVVIQNVEFCANIEYVSLFMLPIPFCMFLYGETTDKRARFVWWLMSVIFTLYSATATIMNFVTSDYHYSMFTNALRFMLVITIIMILVLRRITKEEEELSKTVIWYGICNGFFIMLLDIIRFELDIYSPVQIKWLSKSFSILGVLIFVFSLLLSYMIKMIDYQLSEKEKLRYERLAFIDDLTDVANRAGCLKEFKKIDETKEFALFFFDINNLKYVNDQYGHDAGDRIIKFTADTLKQIFVKNSFCGRFGGDEFIACIWSNGMNESEKIIKLFQKKIDESNEGGVFPFKVSIAYGVAVNSREHPLTKDEALKEADRKMYEKKIEYKKTLHRRSTDRLDEANA